MKRAPILSICIPTYNRPVEFKRLLGILAGQISGQDNSIEVVIRDDSSDNQLKIVENLLGAQKVLYQYFHGEKIGLDLANLFLLEKARGDYVWWVGDDNEILDGSLERIMNVLKNIEGVSFMWINFRIAGRSSPVVEKGIEGFFKDRNEVLNVVGNDIGLLTTLLVKRDEALPYVSLGKKRSVGFGFASLVPVFGILSGPGKFYFMRTPCFVCNLTPPEEIKEKVTRSGKIENDGFYIFGVNFYETASLFKKNFKKRALRRLFSRNFKNIWRGIIVAWIGGWDTPKGKRIPMFKIYWSYFGFWIFLTLSFLPRRIVSSLYKLFKILFR